MLAGGIAMRFDETRSLDTEAVRLGYVRSTSDRMALVALYLARIYDLAQAVEEVSDLKIQLKTVQDAFLDASAMLAEDIYAVPVGQPEVAVPCRRR
jgi:hypothetical protein